MSTGRAGTSLSELRKRTDRQLVILVRGEIERALSLARRNRKAEARAKLKSARALFELTVAPQEELMELEAMLQEVSAALEWPQVARAAS